MSYRLLYSRLKRNILHCFHHNFLISHSSFHTQCTCEWSHFLHLWTFVAATCWQSTQTEEVCIQFTANSSWNELLFQHQWPHWQIDMDFLLLSLHYWEGLTRQRKSAFWVFVCETVMQHQYFSIHISHPFYIEGNFTDCRLTEYFIREHHNTK